MANVSKDINQRDALRTWRALNAFLRKSTEASTASLLEMEKHSKRRINFLLRIHGRYNMLRTQRERRELLKDC